MRYDRIGCEGEIHCARKRSKTFDLRLTSTSGVDIGVTRFITLVIDSDSSLTLFEVQKLDVKSTVPGVKKPNIVTSNFAFRKRGIHFTEASLFAQSTGSLRR